MPARRSRIVPCRLGPFTNSTWACHIGYSMSASMVIGTHVIVPLDDDGWADHLLIIGGPIHPEEAARLFDRPVGILYSRRRHDITDERDEAHAVLLGSWLASSGIQLADWLIMASRTVRSVPGDFGLPRRW